MKIDMHIHSEQSWDCNMKTEKIAKIAKSKRLDGISITDHDTMDRLEKKCNIIKKFDLLSIPGVEIKRNKSDFLIYFVEDENILKIQDAIELIDIVHSFDGIIALAHPYRRGYELPSKEIIERIDAIEVFNSRSRLDDNRKAQQLAEKFNKTLIGGSDAHTYGYIGLGSTIFEGNDINDLKRNLLNNRVKIEGNYPNKILKFGSRLNTILHLMPEKKRYYLRHPLKAFKKLFK